MFYGIFQEMRHDGSIRNCSGTVTPDTEGRDNYFLILRFVGAGSGGGRVLYRGFGCCGVAPGGDESEWHHLTIGMEICPIRPPFPLPVPNPLPETPVNRPDLVPIKNTPKLHPVSKNTAGIDLVFWPLLYIESMSFLPVFTSIRHPGLPKERGI